MASPKPAAIVAIRLMSCGIHGFPLLFSSLLFSCLVWICRRSPPALSGQRLGRIALGGRAPAVLLGPAVVGRQLIADAWFAHAVAQLRVHDDMVVQLRPLGVLVLAACFREGQGLQQLI